MSAKTLTAKRLLWASLVFRPLPALFNVLLLATGVAIILTLAQMNQALDQRFTRDLRGIDLVVGAKGSPLQLILANVFHVDTPTGNIPLADAMALKNNPLVRSVIPLALGDNFHGYRIVGTDAAYINHYNAAAEQGRLFDAPMEAVAGSEICRRYTLKPGDTLVGAHGLSDSTDLHSDHPYTLVGCLKPTGSVIDRLVLTPLESVWRVHEGHHHHDSSGHDDHHDGDHDEDEDMDDDDEHHRHGREITSLLVHYTSPLAAAQLPRLINASDSMQAASPAFEVARLNRLMGTGRDALAAFGALMMGFAAFGFFITLYNAMYERQYDIALMRSLGASRFYVFRSVMVEAMALSAAGLVLGMALSYVFSFMARTWIAATRHILLDWSIPLHALLCVTAGVLVCGVVAGLIPAIRAYRMTIVATLGRG